MHIFWWNFTKKWKNENVVKWKKSSFLVGYLKRDLIWPITSFGFRKTPIRPCRTHIGFHKLLWKYILIHPNVQYIHTKTFVVLIKVISISKITLKWTNPAWKHESDFLFRQRGLFFNIWSSSKGQGPSSVCSNTIYSFLWLLKTTLFIVHILLFSCSSLYKGSTVAIVLSSKSGADLTHH